MIVAEDYSNMLRIAQHPALQARVGIVPYIPEECIVLEEAGHGGFILSPLADNAYSVHTVFLPKTPPKVVAKCLEEMLHFSFIELGLTELWSSACGSNVAARRILKRSGATVKFKLPSRLSPTHVEEYAKLSVEEYIVGNAHFEEIGDMFHAALGEHKDHEDDKVHDAFAGAAIAMVQHGCIKQAVAMYNKWALLSSYAPMTYKEAERTFYLKDMQIKIDDNNFIEEVVCQ